MTAENTAVHFGLIRHAETRWNREKRIQGREDSPLTDAGRRQVRRWAELLAQFSWDRILVSDSGRAKATAEGINSRLGLELTADPRLCEQDWGRWTGKTLGQVQSEMESAKDGAWGAGWRFRPPGGEERQQVWQRSRQALWEAAARWPGERILVVTHEGVIKALVYHLCGRRFLPHEPALLRSYHLHWLVSGRRGLTIEKLNALSL